MLHDLCLEHNKYIKLWLGPAILWILINDPRLIQKVLLSPFCLEKPFFYKFLRLENGLISAKCKVDKKNLKKAFVHRQISTRMEKFSFDWKSDSDEGKVLKSNQKI